MAARGLRWAGVCVLVVGCAWAGAVRGDGVTTAPATTTAAVRPFDEIVRDMQGAGQQLSQIASADDLADASKRAVNAPKVLPLLRRLYELLGEAQQYPQAAQQASQEREELVPMLLVYGDPDVTKEMERRAAGTGDAAIDAKTKLIYARWLRAQGDAPAQAKLADEMITLAREHKDNDSMVMNLQQLADDGNPVAETVGKLEDCIADDMTAVTAKAMRPQLLQQRKLMLMENKPLTLAAKTKEGAAFSTGDWKGRVILVDFWASTNEPWKQVFLPREVKAYQAYHDKGLEVVGICNDKDASAADAFLKAHLEMAWPELFDAAKPGPHALADQNGVSLLPVMFLIDRKGVLRTVRARENLEQMIPLLLAEPAS